VGESTLSAGGAYTRISADSAVFVAHSRAVPVGWERELPALVYSRIWTSGMASWERLARLGLWVEGCAEGMGAQYALETAREPVLQLPPFFRDWVTLTHDGAGAAGEDIRVLATYHLETHYPELAKEALKLAGEIYWSSSSQFDELRHWAQRDAGHACGPGKTARRIRDQGIDPLIFPSVEEWRKWVQKKQS
jgi:hypothetical protein